MAHQRKCPLGLREDAPVQRELRLPILVYREHYVVGRDDDGAAVHKAHYLSHVVQLPT